MVQQRSCGSSNVVFLLVLDWCGPPVLVLMKSCSTCLKDPAGQLSVWAKNAGAGLQPS